MSPDNKQILQLAKANLSADEIAQALNLNVAAVEAVLSQDTEMRREVKKLGDVAVANISTKIGDLQELALATFKDLLQNSDVDSVKLKAAAYIIDERLGLKKPKESTEIKITVVDFNARMEQVKARREALAQKVVDVEAVPA